MQIIVFGTPQSRTSLLTRLINLMGASIGDEGSLLEPAEGLRSGFWKRKDVYVLHQEILRSVGADWYKVSRFDLEKLSDEQRAAFVNRAWRIVQKLETCRPWVLNDPQLSLLFPLWRDLLEVPICVHVCRSPVQVAQSLRARCGFPSWFGIALWEKYTLLALTHTQGLPRLVVSHQDVVEQPIGTVHELYGEFATLGVQGLRCPNETELRAFLKPALDQEQKGVELEGQLLNQTQMALFQACIDRRILDWNTLPSVSRGTHEALEEYEAAETREQTHLFIESMLWAKTGETEQLQRRLVSTERDLTTTQEKLQVAEAELTRAHAANKQEQRQLAAEARQLQRRLVSTERDLTTTQEKLQVAEAELTRLRVTHQSEWQRRNPNAPFFVIGAPRSGTTYLVEVLNRHPNLFITNETRVMTFVNRVLNVLGKDRWVLMSHRNEFLTHLREELPSLIARFYHKLGAPEYALWGDKNPHYADAKTDPDCLRTINQLFPSSRFIHIVRDGRDVVSSIVTKGWADLEGAIDVWQRHIIHAREFGRQVGPGRFIEMRYEDLNAFGEEVILRLLRFLGVGSHTNVIQFLQEQQVNRTPFSTPNTDAGQIGQLTWQNRLSNGQIQKIHQALSDLLVDLGYKLDT